jgi:hypothetical protein
MFAKGFRWSSSLGSSRSRLFSSTTTTTKITSAVSTRGTPFDHAVGDRLYGYRVERISKLNDLELRVIELEHEQTGAKHLHVEALSDANNLFSYNERALAPFCCLFDRC